MPYLAWNYAVSIHYCIQLQCLTSPNLSKWFRFFPQILLSVNVLGKCWLQVTHSAGSIPCGKLTSTLLSKCGLCHFLEVSVTGVIPPTKTFSSGLGKDKHKECTLCKNECKYCLMEVIMGMPSACKIDLVAQDPANTENSCQKTI